MLKILMVGENWMGSSARALREALQRYPEVELEDFSSDFLCPRPFKRVNRILVRLASGSLQREFRELLRQQIEYFEPDVLLVFKAAEVDKAMVDWAKSRGVFTVNVFPDLSPFAHGKSLSEALGSYDLVASTKMAHPQLWNKEFGFTNECVYVGHGYDHSTHYVATPYDADAEIDVCVAATWRAEYGQLLRDVVDALPERPVRILAAGPGWKEHEGEFSGRVEAVPPLVGRSYVRFIRSAKICIAPMTMEPSKLHSVWVPPEQETSRTFQLAAAHCFFVHRRTERIAQLYNEAEEVPLWSGAAELASLIRHYLPLRDERLRLARNAHARAVPAYSIDARAAELLKMIHSRAGK